MKRRHWTADELTILRERYPHERTDTIARDLGRKIGSVYQKAANMGLCKTEEYLASPDAGRGNVRKGMGTRFRKGSKPWNKGAHFIAGGRSPETRFKKGNKPHTWQPIGAERVTRDGILERKVTDHGGYNNKDWRPVHVLTWEAVNGPVPDGHLVVFRDGNRENVVIENLECITRAENMRRNTLHRYPKNVALAIQLRGALTRQINKRERANEEHH